jgi:hypothetical protein
MATRFTVLALKQLGSPARSASRSNRVSRSIAQEFFSQRRTPTELLKVAATKPDATY